MDFNVSEVVEDAEFKELIQCLIDAFEEPPSKLLQLFIPSCPSDDAQATLAEAVERFSLWHRSDPTSTWIKVTDSETGKLLGAANWNIYDTNPYAEGSHSECYWWPEGPGRDAANALMHQLTTPRTMYMSKPHVFLNICFTHPAYRGRGVGTLLVGWGLDQADEKGLETYIDSSASGLSLYRRLGLAQDEKREFSLATLPEGKERVRLEKQLLPFAWWPMHRAVGGNKNAPSPWEGSK